MANNRKRVNLTKAELEARARHIANVHREKSLVRLMYPFIENQKTVYDAQTALIALAGFIKNSLEERVSGILVKELEIDLRKEEDSEIKTAVVALLGQVGPEKAKDMVSLLERFGNTLAKYGASEFMKQPMTAIHLEDIVA